jgi:hypothetical protein
LVWSERSRPHYRVDLHLRSRWIHSCRLSSVSPDFDCSHVQQRAFWGVECWADSSLSPGQTCSYTHECILKLYFSLCLLVLEI